MSTSTKKDGHNPEPITLDWLDTSESPPSSLHNNSPIKVAFNKYQCRPMFVWKWRSLLLYLKILQKPLLAEASALGSQMDNTLHKVLCEEFGSPLVTSTLERFIQRLEPQRQHPHILYADTGSWKIQRWQRTFNIMSETESIMRISEYLPYILER